MNEILAPLYYVFCQEIDETWRAAAAPDPSSASSSASVEFPSPFAPPQPFCPREIDGAEACAEADAKLSSTPPVVDAGSSASQDKASVQTDPEFGCSIAVAPDGSLGSDSLPRGLTLALDAVEADAFFCFTAIMAEVRDHFCSKLDHTDVGITAKVKTMENLIMRKDPELARLLRRLRVSPTFYGFRWITLLFTQEWELPDVLRLWDALLADTNRFEFLLYFATATVISIREDLLEHADFAYAVKALQRFESRVPMHALLQQAHALYRQDRPPAVMPSHAPRGAQAAS
jgi:hypothetical protein